MSAMAVAVKDKKATTVTLKGHLDDHTLRRYLSRRMKKSNEKLRHARRHLRTCGMCRDRLSVILAQPTFREHHLP